MTRQPRSTRRSSRSPRPTTSSVTPEKRKKYDEMRVALRRRGGFRGAGGPAAPASTWTTCCVSGPAALGAVASATCSATCSAAAFGRSRAQQSNRPRKGADAETDRDAQLHRRDDGRHRSRCGSARDAPCPDCSGTGGKPGTKPQDLPAVRGCRVRRQHRRWRVLAPGALPRLRRSRAARLRRALPDLPRQRPRAVVAGDPGAHPGGREGRAADPAARQGRGRRERWHRPATSTSPSR